jgi:hypothetical protein
MFTDSAQHQANSAPQGLIARAAGQVRQLICGMHGHDALLHFDHGRMSLLCTSCGYESPGWEVKEAQNRRQHADASPIVRLPLVGERRVA